MINADLAGPVPVFMPTFKHLNANDLPTLPAFYARAHTCTHIYYINNGPP